MKYTKLFEEFVNEAKFSFGKKGIIQRAQEILAMAKDSKDKNLGFIEKIANTGNLPDYDQHVNINVEKPDQYKILQGSNVMLLAKEIKKVIKKYKKHEVVEERMRGRIVSKDGKVLHEFKPYGKIIGVANRYAMNLPFFYNNANEPSFIIGVQCGDRIDNSIKEKMFNEIYQLLFVFNESNDIDGGVSIEVISYENDHSIIGLAARIEDNLISGSAAMTVKSIMKVK